MTTEALKPCPFCNARLIKNGPFSTRKADCFVHPQDTPTRDYGDCPAVGFRVFSNNPERIEAWNTRPTPLAPWTREELEVVIREACAAAHPADDDDERWSIVRNCVDQLISRPAPTVCPDALEPLLIELAKPQFLTCSAAAGQSSVNFTFHGEGHLDRSWDLHGALLTAAHYANTRAAAPLPPLQKAEGEGT